MPGLNASASQGGWYPTNFAQSISTSNTPDFCSYVIAAGDSFWSIAQKFGVDTGFIQGLNPGLDPQALPIGQVRCLLDGGMR